MSSESKDLETHGIRASLILEALGRPPEHLTETIEKLIKDIDEENGVKVISKKLNPPQPTKERKDIFTTFAEVEVEVTDILYLAVLMFKYMPAHVEVISPELIALTNNGWTDILSELTRRLHGYDEVARVMQYQNRQMQEILKKENLIDDKGNYTGKNSPSSK